MSRRPEIRAFPSANIGLAAILLTVVLLFLAWTKALPWQSSFELQLEFRSSNDLLPGSPVRVAGVDVGEVTEVERGPGDGATVSVSMEDSGLPVHSDARATIRPRTLLEGNFFIELAPGSPSAPELDDGDVIPVGQTSIPVQLDQVLTGLRGGPDVELRGPGGLIELSRALQGSGPVAINDTLPILPPALRDAAWVAEAGRGGEPGDLSGSIRAVARVSAALNQVRGDLDSTVGSFARVSAALASRQRELAATIRGLEPTLRVARPSLAAIDDAVPETRALIRELRPVLRAAPRAIDLTLPVLHQAEGLLRAAELPAFVDIARPTVRSLAAFAPDGARLLRTLRPAAGCLLRSAVPTLFEEIQDPPLTTGQPVYRELLYAMVGLSSASQNFDANGFNTRYYAGFGDELLSTPLGGLGNLLFGVGSNPLMGSRPAPPSDPPPLAPHAPCIESPPPSLRADTTSAGFRATGADLEFRIAKPGDER